MTAYRVRVGNRVYEVKVVGIRDGAVEVEVEGRRVLVGLAEAAPAVAAPKPIPAAAKPEAAPRPSPAAGLLTSKIAGVVRSVEVSAGQRVEAGQTLLVLESMKMEIEVKAHRPGVVREVYVAPGQRVSKGDPLVLIE